MRIRTLIAIALTMFALPALSADPPTRQSPKCGACCADSDTRLSVVFEVRAVRAPVGFCAKAGLKPTGDTPLTDDQLRHVLEAAQADRAVTVTQYPKVTAADGQKATVGALEPQHFITGLDVMKVNGAVVFVPKNVPIDVGETIALTGHVLAYRRRVSVRADFARTAVAGNVDLVPVVTQLTPVFEGGSLGVPVPYTQYLQVPDVKTEKREKTAIVSTDETFVPVVWTGAEEPKGDRPPAKGKKAGKKETPAGFEVAVLVTVRVLPADANVVPPPTPAAPMPREVPPLVTKVFQVSDIVLPADGKNRTYAANAERLVDLVTGMVRPYSWDTKGGRGSAEFFDIGSAVAVRNVPDVVAEVTDLIEALHRLRDNKPKATVADLHAALLSPGGPPAELPQAPPPHLPQDPTAVPFAHSKFRLTRACAGDAACALSAFVTEQKLNARITSDPYANSVTIFGEPALRNRLAAMLEGIDKAAPQCPETRTPAPECQPLVYKLRNTAAADVAHALAAFVTARELDARVVAEPVSNTVLVAAAPATQKRLAAILAELDKGPRQVMARATVVQVPRGFTDRAGLKLGGDAGAKSWTLTPREAHMLAELMRGAKERGGCAVLARPTLQVGDGQPGRVRQGQQYPVVTGFDIKSAGGVSVLEPRTETVELGVTLTLTPRIAPDGKSARVVTDFRLTEAADQPTSLAVTASGAALPVTHTVSVPTFVTSAARGTAEVPFGHTLVLAADPVGWDPKVETLVVVELFAPLDERAAAGWFLK
jgi:hypothetical protein